MYLPIWVSAQNNRENATDIISEILENAAESGNEDDNALALISSEYLTNLYNFKLNINSCTFADLQNLPFLTDYQIEEILNYRLEYGQFYTLGELKGLESLTDKEIRYLQFFIYMGKPLEPSFEDKKLTLREGGHTITTTTKFLFEKQQGYIADSLGNIPFQGDPLAWCIKYRYTLYDKIAWGCTLEKDPGENLSFGKKKIGFDFNSFFFKLQNYGKIEKLVVGDYITKFGEGLVLGGSFSMGKFISSANYAATENTLREYSSTNENWFYRGIATTLNFNRLKITAFVSHNKADAAIEDGAFSSFKTDGYHRFDSEIETKDAVSKDIASLLFSYRIKQFNISFAT